MAKSENESSRACVCVERPLSMEKKLCPPSACSRDWTMNSASAFSVGASCKVTRSGPSSLIGTARCPEPDFAITCEERATMFRSER